MKPWTTELRSCHYRRMQEIMERSIPALAWVVYERKGLMRVSGHISGNPIVHTLVLDYNIDNGIPNAADVVGSLRHVWTEIQYDLWRLNAGR